MNGLNSGSLKDVAAECPGFQARVTSRAVTRFYNTFFKPLGLTSEQFSLLVGIGAAEGSTLVDLADSARIDATTISRNVRNLERRDLVRAIGGRGRAGKRLSLTNSGNQLLIDALPVWNLAKEELSRRMGVEKLGSTKRAMAELAEAAGRSPATVSEQSDK